MRARRRIEAADVDAVDPDAVGDRRRGARKDEPEHDCGRRERDGEEDQAAKHLPDGSGGPGDGQGADTKTVRVTV